MSDDAVAVEVKRYQLDTRLLVNKKLTVKLFEITFLSYHTTEDHLKLSRRAFLRNAYFSQTAPQTIIPYN